MSSTFVAAAHADSSSSASLVITKPTGTVNNDIMLAFIKYADSVTVNSVPSGWAALGTITDATTSNTKATVYWKLASGEGANYTFGLSGAVRCGGTIATYRGGFNTADPVDVDGSGTYFVNDTTLRATTVTIGANDSTAIFLGGAHSSSGLTFTPPTGFAEDVDTGGDAQGRFYRIIANAELDAGATGNKDATISGAIASKYAFLVVLNPVGGASPPVIVDVDEDNTISLEQQNVSIDITGGSSAVAQIRQGGFTYGLNEDSSGATEVVADMIVIGTTGPVSAPHPGSADVYVVNGDAQEDGQAVTITDRTGADSVLVGTPNADEDLRLDGTPDVEAGDYVMWFNVVGGDETDVTVNDDLTWDAADGVTSFDFQIWDHDDGTWGDAQTQTVEAISDWEQAAVVNGFAVASDGTIGTLYLADDEPVPGLATFHSGLAFSLAAGLLYVAPWPSNNAVTYVRGMAVRPDGALVIVDSGTAPGYSGGWALTSRGEVLASTSTPQIIKNGVGQLTTGAVCMSEIS